MATYAQANFGGGSGGTQAPSTLGPVKKKGKKKRPRPANTNQGQGTATNKPQGKRYKWPNGTWHSRPYRGHGGDGGGGGGGQPAKPKPTPYLDRAQNLANIQYGPAEQSLTQRGQAIQPWFQNYMNDVTVAKKMSENYAAPILAGAQTRATQAGQVAPGVDPNSEAGKNAQLAAQARQALGNDFLTMLQGYQLAQNNFMSGQQAVAATAEVGEQTKLAQEKTNLATEKGRYVVETRADLKDKARQAKLENAAFGLDVAKAQASTAASNAQLNKYGYTDKEWANLSEAKRNKIRNKKPKTQGPDLGKVNQYGYTEKQWRGFSTEKRRSIIAEDEKSGGAKDKAGLTPYQQRAARKERGKAINRIREIPSLWNEYSKRKKYIDKEKGTTAPLTAQDIKTLLRKDGYSQSEINLALRVRSGKPLSAGQRATARRLGIYPIPKAWKRGKPTTLNPAPQAPGPSGEMRPT